MNHLSNQPPVCKSEPRSPQVTEWLNHLDRAVAENCSVAEQVDTRFQKVMRSLPPSAINQGVEEEDLVDTAAQIRTAQKAVLRSTAILLSVLDRTEL